VYRIIQADVAEVRNAQWLGGLLRAYHQQTELEKAEHGVATEAGRSQLPAKYQKEIDRPSEAFADASVFIAHQASVPLGMVVLTPIDVATQEVKRLWVDPSARGRGVGASLLREAFRTAEARRSDVLRLTVWNWRDSALRSYRRLGFMPVPSWEDRAGLECLELRLPAADMDQLR
jgi:ribosomal protein S18 acetylase RimI-like enzyme